MLALEEAVGRRLWVFSLAALLLVVGVAPAGGSEDAPLQWTTVFLQPALDTAAIEGLDVLEAYPSYVLALASEAQRAVLTSQGIPWEDASDQRTIRVATGPFDPLVGVPEVPAALRAAPDESRYLLQFTGPAKPSWKDAIEALGGHLSHYVPHNAFVASLPAEATAATASLPFVRWLGPFHPAYRLSPLLDDLEGEVRVGLLTFPGGLHPAADAIRAAGGTLTWVIDDLDGYLEASVDAALLPSLARLHGTRWIEPLAPRTLHNDQAQWVLQSFVQDQRPLWDRGLHGEGQVIGVADTGIHTDHWAFLDPDHPVQFSDPPGSLPPNFTHRKIVNYHVVPPGGDTVDGFGHGTMTTSIIAGDNSVPGGDGVYNGMADKAKLTFTDFYGAVHIGPPPPHYLFNLSYNDTARIQSSSFGADTTPAGAYDTTAMLADAFVWNHKDFVPLFSTGNNFRLGVTLNTPASAKSVLAVGATENGLAAEDMKAYSSGGPTADGRLKPDVVAPTDEWTALDGTVNGFDFGIGTSASTPAAAGAVALIRQYFTEGWYPSGSKTPANGFAPTGALLRAVAINGAREIGGFQSHWHTYNGMAYPNPDQGWGRLHLDDPLFFAGDARVLWLTEHTGLTTGATTQFTVTVVDPTQPLEITLVWADHPGDPATPPGTAKLVNDLDLDVWSPGGSFFVGNVYSGMNPAGSVPGGGAYDRLNPVESVLILPADLEAGDYTVTVRGFTVPQGEAGTGAQPFALVATGGLSLDDVPPEAPALVSAVLAGPAVGDVRLTWEASADEGVAGGATSYAIYAGDAYDTAGAGYAYLGGLAATGSPTYTFDHVGAGDGDPLNHFYYVQANDTMGNGNWSGQAGKFVRALGAGLQLVSLPLEPADASVATVFQTVDYGQVRQYDAASPDPWRASMPQKPTNDLAAVDLALGLWVDLIAPADFVVAGLVPAQVTVDLEKGWNLIGYPALAPGLVGDVLAGVAWSRAEGWDAVGPYHLRVLSAAESMGPGQAYWVYALAAGSVTFIS